MGNPVRCIKTGNDKKFTCRIDEHQANNKPLDDSFVSKSFRYDVISIPKLNFELFFRHVGRV